ncbi:1-acyl-sn-glycerol-3-phosphate acyltransferase [Marinobacterium arenosum]|uniref:1-acyl-sn-glycerol-3-phosphate acyltransferase n=1 Tax=Marinobacterium arenosum TaxID=2862496 RepID=UPI001C93C4E1|nr:1-acyl-sn-glycerol-3-phosphate acyltransferase [Marinobacterium arenosum]MBY4676834.1 1-acyl-sn-glycerol-3-phosphate acyltransferase [Marinobacterium arenosum]
MSQQDPFQEIRPYRDDEVTEVLNRLLYNEEFVSAVTQYQFPSAAGWLGWLLRPLVRMALARKVGDVCSIRDFQQMVADYMEKMIARSTSKLSCSGIDELDPDQAYLFVSNHRDIAMDPAFVNWTRYQMGMDTVRIAIGDNLLSKDYVSDLMRLNKSFIVKRSAKGPREMMAALTQLSQYIDHSIQAGHSVWIAQREGRAKDGNDQTDPAILKMFYMAHRKQRSFSEAIERLNIVPVSISYEYDPCDYLKAKELAAMASEGRYEKAQYEDIDSIVKGIVGDKGHVHVAYGTPIRGEFESPEALAEEIDRQIIDNYYLHPSNYLAAGENGEFDAQQRAGFEARLAQVADGARDILRQMYANPVINKHKQESL